jgi:F0F1-type ATP synthase alpha subunit
VDNAHQDVLADIRDKKVLSDDLKAKLETLLKEFKKQFLAAHAAVK